MVVGFSSLSFTASAGDGGIAVQHEQDIRAIQKSAISGKEDLESALTKKFVEETIIHSDPLVRISEGRVEVSAFLKDMQDTLLQMNELSYNIVKGGGKYMEFNVDDMEKLQKGGWKIKGFTGLEGRRNTFGDLSGIVCYHPEKNVITVVYHGTASNKEGWETNFDGQRLKPWKIQQEFTRDLFEEALKEIKTASKNSGVKEFKKFLEDKIEHEDLSMANILKAQAMIETLAAKGDIDSELGEDLLHAFKLKLEVMNYVQEKGCKFAGQVHRGFLKKYLSTKQEVLGLLKEHLSTMTTEQKQKVKIVFSGHSQAGGTGSLALADLCANHGKELFGPEFDNSKSGTFYGYLLSAARAGNKAYAEWMRSSIGETNIVRQNVHGDPVPIAAGDHEMANLMRELIPGAGELLSSMADYEDAGVYFKDDGTEAWNRARQLYGEKGILLDQFENLDDAVRYIASWIVDEKIIPEGVANKKESSWWNPFSKIGTWWNTKNTITLINAARKGDEKAKEKLGLLLERRFAHFHYGHHREGMGAVFTPGVVGRDLDKMAQDVYAHTKARNARLADKKQQAKQARADEKARKAEAVQKAKEARKAKKVK